MAFGDFPGKLQPMKPKTQELLYFLLWSCDLLMQPTFRNLTDSFEGWAYRNGFHRQLAELERQKLVESQAPASGLSAAVSERVLRLTESGRICALGGRDPELHWRRNWDGYWRLILFDLPVTRSADRKSTRLNSSHV